MIYSNASLLSVLCNNAYNAVNVCFTVRTLPKVSMSQSVRFCAIGEYGISFNHLICFTGRKYRQNLFSTIFKDLQDVRSHKQRRKRLS